MAFISIRTVHRKLFIAFAEYYIAERHYSCFVIDAGSKLLRVRRALRVSTWAFLKATSGQDKEK